jgi:hypothetical protein
VQPANIAISLRRRTPWEAIDLGLSMLQRWWRAVFAPHLIVGGAVAAAALLFSWFLGRPWVAVVLVWWMKPLYDRVVLHVLSRAVFGELERPRAVLAAWREWLGSGLFAAIVLRWLPGFARSFNLPVRQLEGQTGKAGRERRSVLGRRARSYAVWLTVVCMHFEGVLYMMLGGLAELALPAKAVTPGGENLFERMASGDVLTYGGALGYAVAVLLLEPFYVAGGFGLYLNRRTLLEGWDIEVALRRLAERHATAMALLMSFFLCMGFAPPANAQQKDPKKEIAEVLKAKEFGYERDVTRWQSRNPEKPAGKKSDFDPKAFWGIGYALARVAEVLLWGLAAAALAYALWFLARMLPRGRSLAPEPYRPPPALFGMELAPETLPPDVAAAAAALGREGKLREALSLLYRGALSDLVHKRGVQLLASHTEAEVLALSGQAVHSYLEKLIAVWRLCAYAKRDPAPADIEQLAQGYRASFA